ncbi:uncharacterized protein I303_103493 [Kwoniella dejecticola CBS 10117]|uniref:NAD-dependent epimerase/dehydratase domain-containing protein n=1 Tax=Kwoniella dejecticola CBS 10117 TaxID=1296121 RepID=A0A1A6A6Y4_9TREE|nr:uncharacterized protein I303_03516 [Kwoniella dejecticola CBS 10117]OBR85803.1 hypothetical protein I303_03516 [Kwoniella dejecticola CBS 10117]
MRILLTGSSGVVGTYVLFYLLDQGHKVIAVDRTPLPSETFKNLSSKYPDLSSILETEEVDLTSIEGVKTLFGKYGDIEGVIHLAAIPDPLHHDPRFVHNSNVSVSYNVLYTAAERGIKRIVQASSVNQTGLAYTREGRQWFGVIPITEEEEGHAEDPYALSKIICEAQATIICRRFADDDVRITSLRFHHVLQTSQEAEAYSKADEFWAWTSSLAASQACLLGLTSTGWTGHEAFNIVAPDIATPKTMLQNGQDEDIGSLELFAKSWDGKIGTVREIHRDWWDGEGNSKRGFWDCSKAEKMLGWKHNV